MIFISSNMTYDYVLKRSGPLIYQSLYQCIALSVYLSELELFATLPESIDHFRKRGWCSIFSIGFRAIVKGRSHWCGLHRCLTPIRWGNFGLLLVNVAILMTMVGAVTTLGLLTRLLRLIQNLLNLIKPSLVCNQITRALQKLVCIPIVKLTALLISLLVSTWVKVLCIEVRAVPRYSIWDSLLMPHASRSLFVISVAVKIMTLSAW